MSEAVLQYVQPKPCSDLRNNPGRGWMLMMPGPDVDRFADWPWVSLIYHRVCWNVLEPREGAFDWESPQWEGGFGPWLERGFPVGLDVMCASPHGGEYCTPEWVRELGCKGSYERRTDGDPASHGKSMNRWVPDYADPIFKEKLYNFLAAFAARYDNNPLVEYVTLRSYAAWGEWYGEAEADELLNWMVDIHCELFKKTTLVIPESCPSRWPGVILPAIDRGLGVRKDGLGGPTHPGEHALFDRAYHKAPVILEFWGPRQYLKDKGWDLLFDKEEGIAAWHASRVNMGFEGQAREWVNHEPEFLDRMAARMGYRLAIREAWFSNVVARKAEDEAKRSLRVGAWWRNDGVAPYTRNGVLSVTLRGADGQWHTVHEDANAPNLITPVGHYKFEYTIELPASLPNGAYEVALALEDRYKGKITPIFPANPCDEQGRVVLGSVRVLS